MFTNAKLSPFAGRIRHGRYTLHDVPYALPVNYPEEDNACHGFVYDRPFEPARMELHDDHATCILRYQYDGTIHGYPFSYTLELKYTLTEHEGLICSTRVTNCSSSAMPLSDGWHHLFDLGEPIDRLKLKLSVAAMIDLDAQRIPTGGKAPFPEFSSPADIGTRHFDSCFVVRGSNGRSVTELSSERNDLHLSVWQESGANRFKYLVVYTPPDRRSVAIEPMTSNVDAFNNGDGLMVLQPRQEYSSRMGIVLKKRDEIR